MKKVLYALIIGIFFLTGCGSREYKELSFNDLQLKLGNKDSFILVIGSDTCSACAKYKENMKQVMKEKKVEIFYLDLNKLNDDEYSKIYSKYVITSTPTTIFIKDGLETSTYDRIIGAADYSEIVKNLEKHGFIGE